MGRTRLEKGLTDLATRRPDMASEWDAEANGELTPSDVLPCSHSKVWWTCRKGHRWEATPANRVSAGSGCPECARERRRASALTPEGEFLRMCAEANPGMTVTGDFRGMSQPVTARCANGHELTVTRAFKLAHSEVVCRECHPQSEEIVAAFKEKLSSTHPGIEMVGEYSGSKARTRFRCECGAEFERTPAYMLSESRGCPQCRKKGKGAGYVGL